MTLKHSSYGLAAFIGGFFFTTALVQAAPPVNDNFANAATLALGVTTPVNNTDATAEAGEPYHRKFGTPPNKSAWYRLTPDFNGYVELDSDGSASDTVIAVYKGTALAKLTSLGKCDDLTGSSRAKLRIAVTKGVSYSIALDTIGGSGAQQIIARPLLRHQAAVFEAETRFTGLFTTPYKDDHGKLILTLTDKGSVSGKIFTGSKSYPFTSAISADKVIPIIVNRPEQLPVFITATLDTLATGQLKLTAALTGTMGDKAITSTAYQAPKFTAMNPCPRMGTYNIRIGSTTDAGYGICSLVVSNTGACKGTGFLGDGTAFTYSAPLLNDGGGDAVLDLMGKGRVVYHVPLYAGQGQTGGTVTLAFVSNVSTTVAGTTSWFRPTSAGLFIPPGIEQYSLAHLGHKYTPPTAKGVRLDPAFDVNSGSINFSAVSTGLTTINEVITLTTANLLVPPANNPNLVKLTLNVKSGIVTGSVKFNGQAKTAALRAILLPTGSGTVGFYGHDITPVRGGTVSLTSNP